MERCYHHPMSVTRARIHGDPAQRPESPPPDEAPQRTFWEWYGWHYAEDKLADVAAYTRGAVTDPKKPAPPIWRPQLAETQVAQPKTLDDAFNQLSALLG